MRKIIDKYLTREVFFAWLAVTAVLLFILLSNQFARVLGDAAAGKLPRDVVLQVIGLTSITYLTVLVPVGLFLAVMLALGRLFMDSEMTAINACGVGPMQVYRPVAIVSLALAIPLAWLSLYATPWAAAQAHVITEAAKQKAGLAAIEPGRFRSDNGVVFYAEGIDEDGILQNVFLQRRRGDVVELAVARSGEIRKENGDRTTIVLRDGRRYEGVPGTLGFRIVQFGEHGIPVAGNDGPARQPDREATPTLDLSWSSRADAAELHWRLSAPVSVMLLGLLAVPLARTRPRQGRYGRLGIGVAVYLVYANLLGAAQVWIQQGKLSPLLGMWPVHGIFLAAAGLLFWRELRLRGPREQR